MGKIKNSVFEKKLPRPSSANLMKYSTILSIKKLMHELSYHTQQQHKQ